MSPPPVQADEIVKRPAADKPSTSRDQPENSRYSRKRSASRSRSRSPPRKRPGAGARLARHPEPHSHERNGPNRRRRSNSPPQKRPGAAARLTNADREAYRKKQAEREAEAAREGQARAAARGVHDVVKQHYNAAPERGREWRRTESKIIGLRSFNNWVKSCLIQKFSPPQSTPGSERARNGILVLDIGCGKGGDLQKWHSAPQHVELYVGLDPADISIRQARDRYKQMQKKTRPPRLFHGEFHAQDCFGEWIGGIPIIQQVGIDPNVGPNAQMQPYGGGGFDVVSQMFCMHYAFESEFKANTMLRNVSGALKKGGRFIGVIPNSDIIREKLEKGEMSWGNSLYKVEFRKAPPDGAFRPPFGWRYSYFLEEAVDVVPEYVVPWEAFRALADEYSLELEYRETFRDIWEQEKDDRVLGLLSERMGVRERGGGPRMLSQNEIEAVEFYHAFCFRKV